MNISGDCVAGLFPGAGRRNKLLFPKPGVSAEAHLPVALELPLAGFDDDDTALFEGGGGGIGASAGPCGFGSQNALPADAGCPPVDDNDLTEFDIEGDTDADDATELEESTIGEKSGGL